MNYQDLRNLQESYLEMYEDRYGYGGGCYELNERAPGFRFDYNQKHGRPFITPETSQRASETETLGGGTYVRGPKRLPRSKRKYDRQVLSGVRAASDQEKQRARKRMGIEEDIYDIIFSHLLEEGYASTEKEATAIMANMSGEWIDSIIEEYMDEDFDEISEDAASFARRQANKAKLFAMNKKRAPKHGPTQTIPGGKSVRKKREGGWELTKHPDRTIVHPRKKTSQTAGGISSYDPQFNKPRVPKHSSARVSTLDASKVGGIGTKTIKGSERGKKKEKGAKTSQPETETQKRIKSKAAGPQPDPMSAIRGGQSRRV